MPRRPVKDRALQPPPPPAILLPGIDGFEVLRRLRKRPEYVPVLVLSARDAIEDRVHGLDMGADDYLP